MLKREVFSRSINFLTAASIICYGLASSAQDIGVNNGRYGLFISFDMARNFKPYDVYIFVANSDFSYTTSVPYEEGKDQLILKDSFQVEKFPDYVRMGLDSGEALFPFSENTSFFGYDELVIIQNNKIIITAGVKRMSAKTKYKINDDEDFVGRVGDSVLFVKRKFDGRLYSKRFSNLSGPIATKQLASEVMGVEGVVNDPGGGGKIWIAALVDAGEGAPARRTPKWIRSTLP